MAVVRAIANQSNRRYAHDELAALLRVNKHVNHLILGDKNLEESVVALRRNSDIESCYIAVCRNVVHGIPVEDALGQNGPLPKAEEVHSTEVDAALEHATPEHLAKLAGAFTKIHLDLNDDVATAVEAVAMQVAVRGDDLLPHANIGQIATLTLAFAGHDDLNFEDPTNFNDAMDKLASQVTARGDELLPKASAEQLATMRDMFGGPELQLAPQGTAFDWPAEPDYPGALAR